MLQLVYRKMKLFHRGMVIEFHYKSFSGNNRRIKLLRITNKLAPAIRKERPRNREIPY